MIPNDDLDFVPNVHKMKVAGMRDNGATINESTDNLCEEVGLVWIDVDEQTTVGSLLDR